MEVGFGEGNISKVILFDRYCLTRQTDRQTDTTDRFLYSAIKVIDQRQKLEYLAVYDRASMGS